MTQEQEKARELVDKFREFAHSHFDDRTGKFDVEQETNNAKQCAIICVNEFIDEYKKASPNTYALRPLSYWQQVLIEIEKL